MEYKEATAILCDIELHVAVERLRHGDLDIWPLLRLMLWRQLAGAGSPAMPPPPGSRTARQFERFALAARLLFRPKTAYPKAEAVFFIAKDERSTMVAGKAMSPFGDSLKDYAGKMGIPALALDGSPTASPYGAPFSVESEIALAFVRARLSRLRGASSPAIPGLKELVTYLSRAYPQLRLDRWQLQEELRLIAAVKRSFVPVLEAIAPKTVFLACYYNPIAMGLIQACRALGIRTIDVQHGQQGDYHGMYANWRKAGPGGYALMPDNFWCWGTQSADRINAWSRPSWPAQQAIVGGNPWMACQIHQPGSTEEDVQLDALFVPGKTHVLLALQPVDDAQLLPIQQAIALSPPHIRWLVRFHPKMQAERRVEIRKGLQALGTANFETELSSSLPLAGLLKRTEFVMTLWSSVAYEALLFGAHPIIAHENGRKSFQLYIDQDLFSYVASTQDILDLLARGRSHRIAEDNPYIETREDVIFEKLRWAVS
jgi:hypothetical protein